jgi:acyl dehydratase
VTAPVPVGDPVRAHVRVLEAERLRRAPELTPQQQIEADLNELIAVLAAALGHRDPS